MYKVILLLLISTFSYAEDIVSSSSLFKKLQTLGSKKEKLGIKIKPNKFSYEKKNYEVKRITAFIKKGTVIQKVDDDKFLKIPKDLFVTAEEVSPGSHYFYIFNKEGKASYVAEFSDLEDLSTVTNVLIPKLSFSKEEVTFNTSDLESPYKFNAYISSGSHQLSFLNDTERGNSFGASIEGSLANGKDFIPFFLIDFSNLTASNFSWKHFDIGLKLPYKFHHQKELKSWIWIQAKRSIIDSAIINNTNYSVSANSFGIGAGLEWYNFTIALDLQLQKINFPADFNLQDNNFSDPQGYQNSILLSLGKSFEFYL